MDPISISASILTILATIAATVRTAKAFRDYPNEVQALLNELADAQLVVASIESFLGDFDASYSSKTPATAQNLQALTTKLERGQQLVSDLRIMVNSTLVKEEPDEKLHVSARISWLRVRSKVKDLLAQLGMVRQDLYNSHGFVLSSCIQVDLKNVQHGIAGMQMSHTQVLEKLRGLEQGLGEMQHHHKQQALFGKVYWQQRRRVPNLPMHQDWHDHDVLSQDESRSVWSTLPQEDDAVMDSTPFAINAEYGNSQMHRSCGCICHRESRGSFQGFLGILFVGYKGLPAVTKPCEWNCCQRQSSRRLSVTYYFPRWFFLQRVALLAMQTSLTSGFQIKLRFPRIVSPLATVFFVASFGTPTDLCSLFDNDLASPFDINANTGATPLHAAQAYNNAATFDYLLRRGADLDEKDHFGSSANSLLWDGINCGRVPKDNPIKRLCAYTTTDERLQERQFTDLHKSVIRIHGTTVQEELYKLKTSGRHIDDADDGGETALHWAAGRNDQDAVILLLMNGADINRPSFRGRRPLDQAASFCPNSDCATLLLQRGARVDLVENQGRSALCLACTNMSDAAAENVSLLLDYTDAALPDRTGRAALSHAALWNNCAAMRVLIDHGVDLDAQDQSGYTALAVAIHYNHHDAVELLIEAKAAHTMLDGRGRNILHIAAHRSDRAMRQILMDGNLEDLDVELHDRDGQTAREAFLDQKSKRLTAAEAEEIDNFLHSFRRWGESSINQWEDAVEIQSEAV